MMTIVDGPTRIPYAFQALKAGIEYDFDGLVRAFSRGGTLKSVGKSGLQCAVARADLLIERALELIDQKAFFASTWSVQAWRRAT